MTSDASTAQHQNVKPGAAWHVGPHQTSWANKLGVVVWGMPNLRQQWLSNRDVGVTMITMFGKVPHQICGVISYTNWFKVSEYRAPGCCNPCSSSALACMWSSMSCNHNSICIFFSEVVQGKIYRKPLYIHIPMAEGPWCPVKLPLNQPIKQLCTMCIYQLWEEVANT